ncbi:MAG: dioxygenase [Rickettsiaceae bacterium]|nr:dioxygenase [Rickettsiaceae bacterium]
MNQIKTTFIFIILCLLSKVCLAEEEYIDNSSYCEISESAMNDYEPADFRTSNNLLRQAGQEVLFCGEAIVVYGKVLDQNCAPVADAKIYTWQADCKGKYPYKALKVNVVDKKLIDEKSNLTFVGNGTATTNNKGEFHFITVYPPAMHDYRPHLNVRVEHFSMGSLQTRLVLNSKRVKNPQNDPDLASIYKAANEKGMKIYKFEIVIPGKTNKHY